MARSAPPGSVTLPSDLLCLVPPCVLQGRVVLVGDDVVRDVGRPAIQVLGGGAVEPVLVHSAHLTLCLRITAAEVGEGAVLVRDDPAALLLPQPPGEPQPEAGPGGTLLRSAAAQQGVAEGDVLARGDLEFLDV